MVNRERFLRLDGGVGDFKGLQFARFGVSRLDGQRSASISDPETHRPRSQHQQRSEMQYAAAQACDPIRFWPLGFWPIGVRFAV